MGRPRTDKKVIRVARGLRLNPDLLRRIDKALEDKRIIGAHNWTSAVEIALMNLLARSGG
jgi:hypothetical protein